MRAGASKRQGAIAMLMALLLSSCESRTRAEWLEASDLGEVWPAPDGSFLLTQLESGDVVRFELPSFELKWRFRHLGARRHSVIDLPEPRLVCAPEFAGEHAAYLLFSDWLVSLSLDTGTVRWRQRIFSFQGRSACPAAAPDGGLVMVIQRGHGVMKLGPQGAELWSFTLPDRAVASTAPIVVPTSGDVLVRAGATLFSLNPDGKLNWGRPVSP